MYGVLAKECHQYNFDHFVILVYLCRDWSATLSGREKVPVSYAKNVGVGCINGVSPKWWMGKDFRALLFIL